MSRLLAVALSLVAFTACGTGVEPEVEGLSTSEIEGLVDFAISTGLFPSPLPQEIPWPCPVSGTAGRSLKFSSPGAGVVVREGTVTWSGCRGGVMGQEYEISGTVSVHDRFVQAFGGIAEAEGSYTGTVMWKLNGETGSCSLSLTVSADAGRLVLSGTACGIKVERSV